ISTCKRAGNLAARRADINDPARLSLSCQVAAKKRQKRFSYNQQPNQIHFQLLSKLVNRKMSEGTGHLDPGVIDQAIQCARAQIATDLVGCKLYCSFVPHVKQQWNELFSELSLHAIGVLLPTHAAKHPESAIDEHFRRCMPNSSRDSSNNDLFHGSREMAAMLTEALKQAITNFALQFTAGR